MPCSAKLGSWALLALVLMAQLQAAAGSDGRNMPTDYYAFWEGKDLSELTCLSNLPLLQLNKAYGMDELTGTIAGKEASAEFDTSLRHAREAGYELEYAKGNSTFYCPIFGYAMPLYTSQGIALFDTCMVTMPPGFYSGMEMVAELTACEGMEHSQRAITLSSHAANDARAVALGRLDELRMMGAGCLGYSGAGRAAYDQASKLAALDSPPLDAPIEWHYENQTQRHAAALIEAYDVECAFENGSARFNDADAFPKSIALMVGGNENLVTGWIAADARISDAITNMWGEYNASHLAYHSEKQAAEARYSALKDDGYPLIDSALVSRLADAAPGEFYGVEDAGPPAERLEGAHANLSAAEALFFGSELSRASGQECYLSYAINMLNDARTHIEDANGSMAEIEDEVGGMTQSASEACDSRLNEVAALIAGYSTNSSAAAMVKQQAQGELETERGLLASAPQLRTGEKLVRYANVLELAASTKLLLSDENRSIAERRGDANASLQHLCGLAERAESDGLDVEPEKEFCISAAERLALGTPEDFFSIKLESEKLADGIYDKARMRFGYLDARITDLREVASAIRAYASVLQGAGAFSDQCAELESLDRDYCGGGGLEPEKALGHYREIESHILSLEAEFETAKAQLVKEMMEKTAKVEEVAGAQAVVDEPSNESVRIMLSNPLPFGTNSSISISVPIGGAASACTLSPASRSGEIFAAALNGDSAELAFSSVAAGGSYEADFEGECAPVVISEGGAVTKILSLSPEALDAETTLKLRAKRDVEQLQVAVRIIGAPPEISGDADGALLESARAAGSGSAEAILSQVSEGALSVTLRYSVPDPYSIESGAHEVENVTNRTSRVTFTVTATSNGLELADVPVQVPLYNASVRQADIIIRPLGSAKIGSFSAAAMPGGTLVSWKVKRLAAGGSEAFELAYEFDDVEGYARSLLAQAHERLDGLESALGSNALEKLRAKLSEAEQLVGEGKFNDAIATLQDLNSMMDAAFSDAQKAAEESSSFGSRLAEFGVQKDETASISSKLGAAGFDAQAEMLDSAISKADGLARRASTRAENGDYAGAGSLLTDADDELDGKAEEAVSSAISSLAGNCSGESLSNARRALSAGNLEAAITYAAEAKAGLDAAQKEADDARSQLAAGLDLQVAGFDSLKRRANSSFGSFALATTLTVGRAAQDSEVKQLSNQTLGSELSGAKAELESLSAFFSAFRSGDKKAFILKHEADAEGVAERLEALNRTISLADSATLSYKEAAESSRDEAGSRLEQVKKIAPTSEQYSGVIANLTSALGMADSALLEKRYADALVLSERANAGCANLLSAVSEVEQTNGGGTPLWLFALPLLGFAALGFLYFRKKPEQKGPRIIRRL